MLHWAEAKSGRSLFELWMSMRRWKSFSASSKWPVCCWTTAIPLRVIARVLSFS